MLRRWPATARRAFSSSPASPNNHVPKRNELGVQLLSREIHAQLFKNLEFPHPEPAFVEISKAHLKAHGLDPAQGSNVPETSFTLPPLQGDNLDEHFYRIGSAAAEPWLSLSQGLASVDLPPQPEDWVISESGWTKYTQRSDGAWSTQSVDYPPEDALAFDVETLPNYTQFSILATAASVTNWYSWISPWLLQETEDPQQLIPLGDPTKSRLIVGHGVSYDRIRVREEYSLKATKSRFLDTMALHVAVKGISSHQRPRWLSHKKHQREVTKHVDQASQEAEDMFRQVNALEEGEEDPEKLLTLQRLREHMERDLAALQQPEAPAAPEEDGEEGAQQRWEDITSSNSLLEVARLHCGIEMDKTIRNDFMVLSPEEIRSNLHSYMKYCANDVKVVHGVFRVVLPQFRALCPNPVSFSGALTMGTTFLPVNETWKSYIESAESKFRAMQEGVNGKLCQLADEALALAGSGGWKMSPWLSQLDWEPKVAGKSRGIVQPEPELEPEPEVQYSPPSWYTAVSRGPLSAPVVKKILPLLLECSVGGNPVGYNEELGCHVLVGSSPTPLPTAKGGKKVVSLFSVAHGRVLMASGQISAPNLELFVSVLNGETSPEIEQQLLDRAEQVLETPETAIAQDPWLRQLDWTRKELKAPKKPKPEKPPAVMWPKWYWEYTKPHPGLAPGTLYITPRNRISPVLLRLSWLDYPLFYSKEHGWTFRVPLDDVLCRSSEEPAKFRTRARRLLFLDPADAVLDDSTNVFAFYKLPHKNGDKMNVGTPLAKDFMRYLEDGTLKGSSDGSNTNADPVEITKAALKMSLTCSYWISARDRITNQLVVWEDGQKDLSMGFPTDDRQLPGGLGGEQWGIILPQMLTMGTVTRRAMEKTWLTASNAKKDRIGSELKSLIRAPPGYAIVGADVDSEELWIASCMGDAQFGMHGATALGWMTLEGTKAAGTDLHSKTANILGISRDSAKVFNYSRIYGAGVKHATQLLLQGSGSVLPDDAKKRAETLYASTKGKTMRREEHFNRKFWHGGSESYVFNKLEDIAMEARPTTPALGCGVTSALTKEFLQSGFGNDFMTSRINWVVQSSGVDYLHLLIVSMDHLAAKYDIDVRFLIAVHDEVRYLVKEEDKYRAAMAMQVANIWTRSLFAYRLGMDDLPNGVAFFSAVDIDKVLRKEVDMNCVTPSQPIPIEPGESLGISQVLGKTSGGSLWADGRPMEARVGGSWEGGLDGYTAPDCLVHRASGLEFLKAQATSNVKEIEVLAMLARMQRDQEGEE